MVHSVFGRQLLNSKASRLRSEVFHSERMGLLSLEDFVGSDMKTGLSGLVGTKKTHQNENPCKVCQVFSSQSRRFGRSSKPNGFGRRYQRNKILKLPKTEDSLPRTEGAKRIRPEKIEIHV